MNLDNPTDPAVGAPDRPRLDRSVDWLGKLLVDPSSRRVVFAIPGLITIAAGVVLSVFEGGYSLTAWYTTGLFLLVLLALAVALESPPSMRLPRPIAWGLGAYAAFVAFNYLSIAWADVPGDAWAGANRALLFGLALAIAALRPWSRTAGRLGLGVAGVGLLLVAVGTLLVGALGEPLDQFVAGRLSEPAGYANAVATLCLMGVFPLLYFAAAPVLGVPLRGLALGGATALVQISLLAQSRGGAFALAIVAVVYLVIVPQRFSVLLCMCVAGGLTAFSFDTLTDLVRVSNQVRFEDRLGEVLTTIAVSSAIATLVGALAALAAGRMAPVTPKRRRAGNWTVVAVGLAVALVALLAISNPVQWTEARWDDFRSSGYSKVEEGDNRFGGSLGSNRYDYYRVSLDEFADRPWGGLGSENFLVQYLEKRRSNEAPHFPHSLAIGLLGQLGLIGTGLFVAFLGCFLFTAARAMRRVESVEAGLIATALAIFGLWFVHGLVDWIWAFSGLGVIAFALLALAARSGERPAESQARPFMLHRKLVGPLAGIVALALAVSLALPGLAARYVSSAYDAFATGSPEVAFERLDRASDLDFLSAEPLVAKGILARRAGRPRLAREAFAEALDREPRNWFARLEHGMSLAQEGRRQAALGELRQARLLNPRQPLIPRLLDDVRAGKPVEPIAVERELNSQLTDKLGALPAP